MSFTFYIQTTSNTIETPYNTEKLFPDISNLQTNYITCGVWRCGLTIMLVPFLKIKIEMIVGCKFDIMENNFFIV